MNKKLKKALLLSAIGFVIGVLIGVMFLYMNDPKPFSGSISTLAIVLHLLVSGIYGGLVWGTTVVYDIEHWSILRATLVHFLITCGSFCCFYALGVALDWIGLPPIGVILIFAAAFIGVYFIIWLIMYLSYRRKIRKLNEDLQKRRSR